MVHHQPCHFCVGFYWLFSLDFQSHTCFFTCLIFWGPPDTMAVHCEVSRFRYFFYILCFLGNNLLNFRQTWSVWGLAVLKINLGSLWSSRYPRMSLSLLVWIFLTFLPSDLRIQQGPSAPKVSMKNFQTLGELQQLFRSRLLVDVWSTVVLSRPRGISSYTCVAWCRTRESRRILMTFPRLFFCLKPSSLGPTPANSPVSPFPNPLSCPSSPGRPSPSAWGFAQVGSFPITRSGTFKY